MAGMSKVADVEPRGITVNIETGDLYPNLEAARRKGIPTESLVEVNGSPEAIEALSGKLAELCRRRRQSRLDKAVKERAKVGT
jgi:hypothetical protein